MKVTECDNQYSITTKDLALSLNKAAQSSATYGASLDQLVGYTTAIGSSTRESGSIVGNSLKTIFSRIGTLSKAQDALSAVGVSVRDQSGEMKDVSVVIDELGQKWQGLTKEQQTNTLVNVAGVHHQNRLAALMNNYQTAIDSTTTSMNSQGSAMREQEKFNTSLQGRLNQLNTAWIDLSNTVGQNVLYDGIVVVTKALESMSDGGNSVVSTIGLLPPLFGTAYTAVFLLSSGFRSLTIGMGTAVGGAIATTVATGSLTTGITALRASVAALGITWKSFLASTGVGAVFIGIGFAIEKLTKVMSENIQQQEEFDLYLDKNTKALTDNNQQVDELIAQYNSLSSSKANSDAWNSDKEQKYLEVQQKLGEIFPALIDKVDSTGQTHLKSAKAIEEEIRATEKLVEAQNKVTRETAKDEFKNLNDSLSGGMFDSFDNFINGSLKSQIDGTKKIIEALRKQGDDDLVAENELKLLQLEQMYQEASEEIKGYIFEVANSYSNLEIGSNVAESLQNFVSTLDLSGFDETQLNVFAKDFSAIQDQIQRAVNTKDAKLYDGAIKSLHELASETNDFDGDLESFKLNYEDFIKAVENGKVTFVEGEIVVEEMSNSMENASGSAYELKTAMEQLAGVSQQQIDDTDELLFQYNQLTAQMQGYTEAEIKNMMAKGNLSSEEQFLVSVMQDRAGIMTTLDGIYPSLLDKDGKAIQLTEEKIKAIQQENKANEILLKAYQLSRDGKLTAEQNMTVASASATKARIDNIRTEIQALNVLQKKLQEVYNEQAKNIDPNDDSYTAGYGAYRSGTLLGQAQSKVNSYTSELDSLQSQLNTNIGKIDSFSTAIENSSKSTKNSTDSTNKSSDAKSKENKEIEKSIYLADLYKRKLDELNLAIQKEISLREKLPDHDAKFTSSLQTQLKLENEKLATMKAQEQSINAQIKAGKIQTTGMVKQSEAVKTTTKKLGGFQGRITSKFGERADNHRGTDIASAKGTGIDSFAGGKVIAAGYAGKKGAEKMHSSYGNVVVVQSDDGTKRLYAHMEKVLVKVGQQIDAGARIGTVGSTGNSTGPHLHYEKTQNGKLVDSYGEVAQARKGVTTTSGGTTEVQEVAQNVDQAKSDLIGIQNDILAQEKAIYELQVNMVDASLSGFEQKKSNYDKFLENNDNRLNKLTKSSQAYRDELVKSSEALKAKKSVNQAEIEQLKKFIDSGTLTAKVVEEYTERLHELGKLNSEIDFSLKDINASELESYVELVDELLSKYDKQRNSKDVSIDYDTVALEELDKSSNKYLKSLEKINSTMKEKQTINRHELNSLEQLITNGKLYGDALDNAKDRVNELKKEIKQLQLDIQEGNFNIIVNVKTQSDSKVDDLQFEIDRAEAIRKMYEEGSADYTAYTQKIIEASKKMAEQHLKTRDSLVEELKQRDITIERRKEILELLEDEHMAYLNATLATKDYVKQQQDAVESQRKAIADKVVDAYKSYVQERKDEHMKMLDDEMDRENKKHEKAMKQLNDEMDLYRKNVDEKLRLIDRQEADRDYNMDIADMEKERSKVQSEIDRLSMDNSNEAKSKRKKLQEQLDQIDKDIAEKRHDRDIELQKQGLNDLLESKEEEINGKIEIQDKEHQDTINKIEREKKYWDKHYTDLLNDERKFAQMREDIMNGNFANIQAEFQEYIQQMIDTMPLLEDSMDGTMNAVGTSIRQNVIDSLREAMDMVNEFNSMQIGSGGFNDGLGSSGGIGDIAGDAGLGGSSGSGGQSSQGKLVSDADLKVIMAKYMTDVLASQYNDVRAANIREKAHAFAREGRAEGASIPSDSHYNTELAKLSKEDKIRLGNLASSNSSVFDSTEMQNAIKRWASSLKNRASALSGGMTSWSGNGIDGKGGKEMIVHPNELINSPLDTKNLLDMSNVMHRAMQFFTPVLNTIARPSSLMNNISNSSGGDTYEIVFTGDINNTSKSSASQFAKDFMNDIRTKKGGRF